MRKSILTILAALLILFFDGMETRAAKTESNQQAIPNKIDEEISYVALPIETIFNTKNKDMLIRLNQRNILASFNGGVLLIPAYAFNYKPIKNEKKNDFEGGTVSLSYLKNFFDIDDSFLSNKYEIVFEYTSEIPVFMNDNSRNAVAINENYFRELKKNPRYSELKEIKFFQVPDFVISFVKEDSEIEMLWNSTDLITISEYLETIYKKYVPMNYWPVSFVNQIENNNFYSTNLPKLKEDILNSSLEGYNILLIFKEDNNDNPYKIALSQSYRDPETKVRLQRDLYTDQIVNPHENEAPYVNLNNENDDILLVNKETNTSTIERITNIHLVDTLKRMIWEATTVREVVELYEQLPTEYQVDYSYFDFTNSPNVDPAWLANRPTPAPTPIPTPTAIPTPAPTPLPYAELTIGSSGREVLDMKQRFYELGYFRTTEFSDQFNANTADTVKQFEKNNGLKVDGVADAVMLGLLFSDSAVGK